jgi:hypothetical protein
VSGVKDPYDIPFKEANVTVGGTAWKFRELSVEENDECLEKSRRPDNTIDGRVLMRLQIVKASVEPKITLDKMVKLPNRAFLSFADTVNDLLAPEEGAEEGEPKND